MGFFYASENQPTKKRDKRIPVELLRDLGCRGCPLDTSKKLDNPKLAPDLGESQSPFYLLFEKPTNRNDLEGDHLSDDVLDYLSEIDAPMELFKIGTLDFSVRCHSDGTDVGSVETFSCQKNWRSDIETLRPWAVIGFGRIPLQGLAGKTNIGIWRGKRFPVKFGDHVCWFYPVTDPIHLMKNRILTKKGYPMVGDQDRICRFDLERVMMDYENRGQLSLPEIHGAGDVLLNGITVLKKYDDEGYKKICRWLEWFESKKFVSIDYETKQLRPYFEDSKLLTVSLSTGKRTVSFPLDHPDAWSNKHGAKVKQRFKEFLLHKTPCKIAHNLSMEMEWSGFFFGREVLKTNWHDTMAQAYVLDQRQRKKGESLLDLDSLVFRSHGLWIKSLHSFDIKNMDKEPIDKVLEYNAVDAKYTFLLFEFQNKKLSLAENKDLLNWVLPHHVRTSRMIVNLQLNGLLPDFDEAERIDKEMAKQQRRLEKEIFRLPEVKEFNDRTGRVLNPLSTDDVAYILKDILKCPEVETRKNKKGYTVDEAALQKISEKVTKLPRKILDIRSVTMRRSNWINAIYRYSTPDGFLHPNYNDKFTATGRLSSSDPQLQNYPKHKNSFVRKMIRAPEGKIMVLADYGSIEFRCVAMASEDQALIDSLCKGLDVHQHWADRWEETDPDFYDKTYNKFDLDPDDEPTVKKQMRYVAKNSWVFPNVYGAGAQSCADYLDVPLSMANKMQKEFFKDYSTLKSWQRNLLKKYEKKGFVESVLGRRRYAPVSYNELINTSIQSLATDLTIDAMNRLLKEGFFLVMNNHDEIGFYMNKSDYKKEIDRAAEIMLFPGFDFVNVPLVVEFTTGNNWDDQEFFVEISTEDFE